jgi:hypothetical protein
MAEGNSPSPESSKLFEPKTVNNYQRLALVILYFLCFRNQGDVGTGIYASSTRRQGEEEEKQQKLLNVATHRLTRPKLTD